MKSFSRIYLPLGLLLFAVANTVFGQSLSARSEKKTDLSAVTIQAPVGFWYPTSFFNQPANVNAFTLSYGLQITAVPENPPLLGHFDKSGRVVNGDYVLVEYIDLNTAPITRMWLDGYWATVAQPIASGPALVDQPLRSVELGLGATNVDTQIRGTEGTVILGLALLKRANQSLDTAWGATLSQVIRIDDTTQGFPYGNYISPGQFSTASFTIGGAAHFNSH